MYINFEYENGGNPYVAKTADDLFRMVKKYVLEQIGEQSFRVVAPAEYWTVHTGKKLTVYKKAQTALRDFAIEWQNRFSDMVYSWSDICFWDNFFLEYGKKYGLLKEFRENGIC